MQLILTVALVSAVAQIQLSISKSRNVSDYEEDSLMVLDSNNILFQVCLKMNKPTSLILVHPKVVDKVLVCTPWQVLDHLNSS